MNTATLRARAQSWPIKRWMRDPFLHFVCIGLALLVLYDIVSPPRAAVPGSRIELTTDDLKQIDLTWQATWQRHPTEAEMHGLVEDKIREEVLYREAIAMGLDQDDSIVKRRLAQKLEFLTEDMSAVRTPSTQELQAWFPSHAAQFAAPGRVTFRHIYFSPDQRGQQASSDATSALASLAGKPADAPDIAKLGDRFPDQRFYAEQSPEQVANVFGSSFSQALLKLKPGSWRGPIQSGLGWHLVWIDALVPTHVPTFSEVDRKEMEDAWIDEQQAAAKRKAYDAIRAKYDVVLPAVKTS
jgi:parvulin-like peptidyl-prolyl isomerase